MTTTTFTAKEAKNNFGRLLDEARDRPVSIERHGRNVAVVLSFRAYEEFESARDAYWGRAALRAEKSGSIGVAKSARILRKALNARR